LNRTAFRLFVPALFALLLLPACGYGAEAFTPDDPYFPYDAALRPTFPGQWHLKNTAPATILFTDPSDKQQTTMVNAGVSANLTGSWSLGYTGSGVIIGIVDDGVDGTNYDLAPNYRSDLSRNFSDDADLAAAAQGPQQLSNNHGTAVAGVAAARGGNKLGGTGAAPFAQIAGLRINIDEATDGDPDVSAKNYRDAYYWYSGVNSATGARQSAATIRVKNHSYGPSVPFLDEDPDGSLRLAVKRTALNKVIHVWSAGNDRKTANEDSTKQQVIGTPYVITVAALGSDGKFANYSSFGANVFVTAPSSRSDLTGFGITTTDRTGDGYGYNRYSTLNPKGDSTDAFSDTSYTSTFGGTSSSAPLVSGIMALGVQANAAMDLRMAQHVLVRTSDVVDSTDASASSSGGWRTNGAGFRFNPNYGFGNINAGKFVEKLREVGYVTAQTSHATGNVAVNAAIPDDDIAGITRTFSLTAAELDQPLESIVVGYTFTHERRGQLTGTIASPSGMSSRLFYSTKDLAAEKQDAASVTNFAWDFLSNAFWGESGIGTWTVGLADLVDGYTGTWNSYRVTLYMGKLVLISNSKVTQSNNIRASSFTMMADTASFENPAGLTLDVEEDIIMSKGEFIVNGAVTEDPTDYSNAFYMDGGTLSGTGTIDISGGFFHNGGTISPGNSIGTLTITGDYAQRAGATLHAEVASPALSDLLVVNGSASLDGILRTTWTGGAVPDVNAAFGNILTATGGVTGSFSTLLTNITPTRVFKPRYLANSVHLVVERDYANANLSSALSGDQAAVGTMLNSVANTTAGTTGDLDTVLNAVDDLSTYGAVAAALDSMKPKGQGAMFNMGVQGASFQSGNLAGRLEELRAGSRGLSVRGITLAMNDSYDSANGRRMSDVSELNGLLFSPDQRWGVFAAGNYGTGDKRGDDAYSFRSYGVTIGADYRFSDRFFAGLAAGSYQARTNIDDGGSTATLSHKSLSAYGTYQRERLHIDGHLGYGWNGHDNDRKISFPGVARTAHSEPGGSQFEGYGGLGYEIPFGRLQVIPSLSLQYVRYRVDSYVETGADSLNLSVNAQTSESLRGRAGGRVGYVLSTGAVKVMPSLWAFYAREFGNTTVPATARLAQGGDSCTATAHASPRRDFFQAGAGIAIGGPAGTSAYLNYNADFDFGDYQDHSIGAGIRWEF